MDKVFTSPTLGEVVRYIVTASGVMARKARDREDDTEFDEGDAKSYQKSMERLAAEECHLQKVFEEITRLHSKALSRYIQCPLRGRQINDLLNDLFDSYSEMIKLYGTYMTKLETARYYLTTYAVDVGVRSVAWAWLKGFGYFENRPQPPDLFWYLPELSETGFQMPFDRVLDWAYACCGQTLATFHHPIGIEDPIGQLQRNERAARSWRRGSKRPPALPTLVKNLKQSFQAQADAGQPVPTELQSQIITTATIARIATCIALDIQDAYGADYLQDIVSQIRLYATWIREELNEYVSNFEQEFSKVRTEGGRLEAFSAEEELKRKVSLNTLMAPDFWAFFNAKRDTAKAVLYDHIAPDGGIDPRVVAYLDRKYGTYAARVLLDVITRWKLDDKPAQFDEYMEKALQTKDNPKTTLADVDRLSERMHKANVAERLPWMLHWIRGVVLYRAADYKGAAPHYVKAFKDARYSAGSKQYLLVNQYLEVMAKTRKWLAFKQGAQWACYLGLPVRWLRDKEPTDENIRNAYGILGLAKVHYVDL
ncbi:hypothetical protein [Pseudomonas japonica]|uniref:hypothetical protein n=1 Tax=Pseudomonas japonica TaxID=256466 RepID=UPI0015E3A2B9|nr:hypothetical protein [Pseudomonas japonica]MBA1245823.1 hypothetical protein [Pseudomonas japonica]